MSCTKITIESQLNKESAIPDIVRIVLRFTKWRYGPWLTAHVTAVVQWLLPYCNLSLPFHKFPAKTSSKIKHLCMQKFKMIR